MNKTNRTNRTNKTSGTSCTLGDLNLAWRWVQKEHVALMAAMERDDVSEVARLKKISDLAFEKFSKIRRGLPEVKFDSYAGVYFFAKDEAGNDVHHVLCEIKAEKVIEVTAKNESEAVRNARRSLIKGGLNIDDATVDARVVSENG